MSKRNVWKWLFLSLLCLFPLALLAQDPSSSVTTPDQWSAFLQSVLGWRGLTTLGIVGLAIQGLLLVANSSFDPLPAATKLLVVTSLTLLAGVLSLKVQGLSWGLALMHSTTLAALQVFLNQIKRSLLPAAADPVAKS